MIKLTEKEQAYLKAVAYCEYHNGETGEDAIDVYTWADSIGNGDFGTSAGGIASSLSKKGLVKCTDDGHDDLIAVTREGWETLQAIKEGN